jgi:hypothetical protein
MARPKHPEVSPREPAAGLGMSLGNQHHLPKALRGKGCGKAENAQRSDNQRHHVVVLTPQGVRQRMRSTPPFLARKVRDDPMLDNRIVWPPKVPAPQAERQP